MCAYGASDLGGYSSVSAMFRKPPNLEKGLFPLSATVPLLGTLCHIPIGCVYILHSLVLEVTVCQQVCGLQYITMHKLIHSSSGTTLFYLRDHNVWDLTFSDEVMSNTAVSSSFLFTLFTNDCGSPQSNQYVVEATWVRVIGLDRLFSLLHIFVLIFVLI